MGYFYGTLAVLGWGWTAIVVIGLVLARQTPRRNRAASDVIQSNDRKH